MKYEIVDDELVDGGSMDVKTWDSVERGLIEVCTETSESFACEELKDDDRERI